MAKAAKSRSANGTIEVKILRHAYLYGKDRVAVIAEPEFTNPYCVFIQETDGKIGWAPESALRSKETR